MGPGEGRKGPGQRSKWPTVPDALPRAGEIRTKTYHWSWQYGGSVDRHKIAENGWDRQKGLKM